jgi:hypothetical protein
MNNTAAAKSIGYVRGYALLRFIPESGSEADVAKAVAFGKRIKLYPLSQAAKRPATTFVDVVDVVYAVRSPRGPAVLRTTQWALSARLRSGLVRSRHTPGIRRASVRTAMHT